MKSSINSQRICLVLISALVIIALFLIIKIIVLKKAQSLNLIIISIDTLRPDHMGVYGYNKDTTPNIDKFAQGSVVFTDLRTVVPMTFPSFASLMTGKTPFNTKLIANQVGLVSENSKTLATYLKDQGYQTVSYTTGALKPSLTNLNQGFDKSNYLTYKGYFSANNNEYHYQTDRTEYEQFINSAGDWLNSNKNKKFFLWVHLMDPHPPYQPPDDLKCKFNQKYCDYISSKSNEQLEQERGDSQFCHNGEIPSEKLETFETLYDGGVAYSDRLVGSLLDQISKDGLDKNTIVMIYGDHGEGFDHNYFFNHREVLYDSALKIPLIIKYPYANSGKLVSKPLDNLDILPTVLDLMGISYNPELLAGSSFSNQINILSNVSNFFNSNKYQYFSNYNYSKFAIFDGQYKYIYSLPSSCLLQNQTEELYDIKNDPKELKNLLNNEQQKTSELKTHLLNYLSTYNLPLATTNQPSVYTSDEIKTLPY